MCVHVHLCACLRTRPHRLRALRMAVDLGIVALQAFEENKAFNADISKWNTARFWDFRSVTHVYSIYMRYKHISLDPYISPRVCTRAHVFARACVCVRARARVCLGVYMSAPLTSTPCRRRPSHRWLADVQRGVGIQRGHQ